MSRLGRARGPGPVDPELRAILAAWSREPDRERARARLAEAAAALDPERRGQLADRLAEIALGSLAAIEAGEPEAPAD